MSNQSPKTRRLTIILKLTNLQRKKIHCIVVYHHINRLHKTPLYQHTTSLQALL